MNKSVLPLFFAHIVPPCPFQLNPDLCTYKKVGSRTQRTRFDGGTKNSAPILVGIYSSYSIRIKMGYIIPTIDL
uniref:ORF73b n=1 Tax=Pinus koraiensis TaxID=88728 RepID=Q85WY1_PINKO|nr:ORF73b [Pinus koraiensis]AAO74088.1 ORF73b [Pinus koraiensis]